MSSLKIQIKNTIKFSDKSEDFIHVEIGKNDTENDLKDLLSCLIPCEVSEIKGFKDKYNNYFTLSSIISNISNDNYKNKKFCIILKEKFSIIPENGNCQRISSKNPFISNSSNRKDSINNRNNNFKNEKQKDNFDEKIFNRNSNLKNKEKSMITNESNEEFEKSSLNQTKILRKNSYFSKHKTEDYDLSYSKNQNKIENIYDDANFNRVKNTNYNFNNENRSNLNKLNLNQNNLNLNLKADNFYENNYLFNLRMDSNLNKENEDKLSQNKNTINNKKIFSSKKEFDIFSNLKFMVNHSVNNYGEESQILSNRKTIKENNKDKNLQNLNYSKKYKNYNTINEEIKNKEIFKNEKDFTRTKMDNYEENLQYTKPKSSHRSKRIDFEKACSEKQSNLEEEKIETRKQFLNYANDIYLKKLIDSNLLLNLNFFINSNNEEILNLYKIYKNDLIDQFSFILALKKIIATKNYKSIEIQEKLVKLISKINPINFEDNNDIEILWDLVNSKNEILLFNFEIYLENFDFEKFIVTVKNLINYVKKYSINSTPNNSNFSKIIHTNTSEKCCYSNEIIRNNFQSKLNNYDKYDFNFFATPKTEVKKLDFISNFKEYPDSIHSETKTIGHSSKNIDVYQAEKFNFKNISDFIIKEENYESNQYKSENLEKLGILNTNNNIFNVPTIPFHSLCSDTNSVYSLYTTDSLENKKNSAVNNQENEIVNNFEKNETNKAIYRENFDLEKMIFYQKLDFLEKCILKYAFFYQIPEIEIFSSLYKSIENEQVFIDAVKSFCGKFIKENLVSDLDENLKKVFYEGLLNYQDDLLNLLAEELIKDKNLKNFQRKIKETCRNIQHGKFETPQKTQSFSNRIKHYYNNTTLKNYSDRKDFSGKNNRILGNSREKYPKTNSIIKNNSKRTFDSVQNKKLNFEKFLDFLITEKIIEKSQIDCIENLYKKNNDEILDIIKLFNKSKNLLEIKILIKNIIRKSLYSKNFQSEKKEKVIDEIQKNEENINFIRQISSNFKINNKENDKFEEKKNVSIREKFKCFNDNTTFKHEIENNHHMTFNKNPEFSDDNSKFKFNITNSNNNIQDFSRILKNNNIESDNFENNNISDKKPDKNVFLYAIKELNSNLISPENEGNNGITNEIKYKESQQNEKSSEKFSVIKQPAYYKLKKTQSNVSNSNSLIFSENKPDVKLDPELNINDNEKKNENISVYNDINMKITSFGKNYSQDNFNSMEQLLLNLERNNKISHHQYKYILQRYKNNEEILLSAWEVYLYNFNLSELIETLRIFSTNVRNSLCSNNFDKKTPITITRKREEFSEFLEIEKKDDKSLIFSKQFNIIEIFGQENMIDRSYLNLIKNLIYEEDAILISAFEILSVNQDVWDFSETVGLICENYLNSEKGKKRRLESSIKNYSYEFYSSLSYAKFCSEHEYIKIKKIFEDFLVLNKTNFSDIEIENLRNKLDEKDDFIISSIEFFISTKDSNELIENLKLLMK